MKAEEFSQKKTILTVRRVHFCRARRQKQRKHTVTERAWRFFIIQVIVSLAV